LRARGRVGRSRPRRFGCAPRAPVGAGEIPSDGLLSVADSTDGLDGASRTARAHGDLCFALDRPPGRPRAADEVDAAEPDPPLPSGPSLVLVGQNGTEGAEHGHICPDANVRRVVEGGQASPLGRGH
jgi:hypothetical protein